MGIHGKLKTRASGGEYLLKHCPVTLIAIRGSAEIPATASGDAGADTEVEEVEIATRSSDGDGRFTIPTTGVLPTDQLALKFVLEDDEHKVSVKPALGAPRPYTLRVALEGNPLAAGYTPPEGDLVVVAPTEGVAWPGATAEEMNEGVKAAMVYSVLVGLNRWFDANRATTGQAELPAATATYPNRDGSYYHVETTEVRLETGEHPTIVAHEYGHHVYRHALNGYSVGGEHSVVTRRVGRDGVEHDGRFGHTEEYIARAAADPEERRAFRRQLAIDCSEGYASVIACAFFQSPTYRGRFDVERLTGRADDGMQDTGDWCAGLGDLMSAGYLWDLCDPASGDDSVCINFFELHAKLIAWGAGLGSSPRLLGAFHRYLKAHSDQDAELDRIATQNTLRFDLLEAHGILD